MININYSLSISMATSVDLIKDLAIVQGKTFEKINLRFPGDVSLWTPRAQIRAKWYFKEAGQSPLIEFSFPTLTYDPDADKTLVQPQLTAAQTAGLVPTKYQGEGKPDQNSAYVWDLDLEEPETGRIIGLQWGWVQVVPEV